MAEPLVEVVEPKDKKSASTLLVDIALEQYHFGVSTLGEAFALPKKGPKVISLLRGSKTSLRAGLARTYFSALRKAAPQQALADAMLVLDGFAQEAEEHELFLRVAQHRGDLWLDLGDLSGRAVRVQADGWEIRDKAPVYFKRTTLMSALPDPAPQGSLEDLWQWLNVAVDDRPIVAAWLVSALFHDIPHPVLAFFGEHGTGKSTAQKLIVSTLDPGPVPTRKPPRDAESWVTAAAGSWLVGIDNMSDIPDWLSDSMCRAVTGDGDVRRRLYTDQDHAVFAFRRCICLNSIDLGALRGDLAERMLPINLVPISEQQRLLEEEIWPRWREAHPRILAGLLDLAAGVLKALPFVELLSKPRMADFARILAAVDSVLGTRGLSHYLGKQSSMAADSLSGDPFVTAIVKLGGFEGTSAELLERITPEKLPKGWPSNPRVVTQRLRRQAPVMRKAGITITDDGGANHDKVVRWSIQREIARISHPQHPQHPQGQQNQGNGTRVSPGDAGMDPRTPDPQAPRDPQYHPLRPPENTRPAGIAGIAGMDYGTSQEGQEPSDDDYSDIPF